MKGMVFTEFLDVVEDRYGDEVLDELLETTELGSGGAYTAVGTYDHRELIKLVENLSQITGVSSSDILVTAGTALFSKLAKKFPELVKSYQNSFELLQSVENHIHVEVHKLYPDAELPKLDVKHRSDTYLELEYKSTRALGSLAEGLIRGSANYYGESIDMEIERTLEEGTEICLFKVSRKE
ncbi:MAG: heme NO-binding domain-containing protein [Gammaproteobacteria bacterium]|nr:heme NO-binding domain-containing protein [Gammaproteobacteria bacterium]